MGLSTIIEINNDFLDKIEGITSVLKTMPAELVGFFIVILLLGIYFNWESGGEMKDEPAFPRSGQFIPDMGEQTGMTLRDYFAGQALACNDGYLRDTEMIAIECYKLADAMLVVRAKTQEERDERGLVGRRNKVICQ